MPTTTQAKRKGFLIKVDPGIHEAAMAYSKREQIPVAVLIRQLLKSKLRYDQQAELDGVQK
ncbi:MAG: hypothetical protein ACLP5H_30405 [Desulfomonilaceae bacterium]